MKTRTVSLRISFGDWTALSGAAKKHGKRPSELLRQWMRDALFEKSKAGSEGNLKPIEESIQELRADVAVSMEAVLVLSKTCRPEEACAWAVQGWRAFG